MSEWEYNSQLAPLIATRLRVCGLSVIIVDRYEGGDYPTAMSWLVGELTDREAQAALELHFNSYNGAARGHEWLHSGSDEGSALADALDTAFRSIIPELPARGVKERSSGDGSTFLRSTPCPSVIGEPFFGSSVDDWAIAQDTDRMANAYATGIRTWLGTACRPRRAW